MRIQTYLKHMEKIMTLYETCKISFTRMKEALKRHRMLKDRHLTQADRDDHVGCDNE